MAQSREVPIQRDDVESMCGKEFCMTA